MFYWSPDIYELKRDGRLYDALNLARECMLAAEHWDLVPGDPPPPGWVLKVAVIERKLGNLRGEIEALERWCQLNEAAERPIPSGNEVERRLAKAQVLLARQ